MSLSSATSAPPVNTGGGVYRQTARSFNPANQSILNNSRISEAYTKCKTTSVVPKCFDYKNIDSKSGLARCIDPYALSRGQTQFKDYTGYVSESGGIKINRHYKTSSSRLKFERAGRIAATAGAVGFNAWAAIGLITGAGKLFFNTLSGNDTDEAYSVLGKAYSGSSVAGALTGVSQESATWTVGAAGMGLSSGIIGLNNMAGLSLFSIADGLQAIGMGGARKRDEKNLTIYENSVFSTGALSSLKFLMPIEQAIKKFFTNFYKIDKITNDEPYSLFQEAGGGLVSGGAILGLASVFQNKLSESVKNFFYVPYSLLSAVNLIAFFRDGSAVIDRAKKNKGKKSGIHELMNVEGWFKRISAPVLGLNNVILGFKGLGFDPNGSLYNIAMSLRGVGAAIAFGAFGAQSIKKFRTTQEFGANEQETFHININPKAEAKAVLDTIKEVEDMKKSDRTYAKITDDKFHKLLCDPNNGLSDVIDDIIKTKNMQVLADITQAGLPTPMNRGRIERWLNNRLVHSKRVAAVSMIVIDTLIDNTKDKELKDYLISKRNPFILTALLHDVGHIALSHMTEFLVEGHNNDEGSYDVLKDNKSPIFGVISKHFGGDENANKMLKEMRAILGKDHSLSKLYKLCDFIEYTRTGDYTKYNLGFPRWDFEDILEYSRNVVFDKDEKGKEKVGFTEKGAKIVFDMLYDRKLGCDYVNNRPDVEMSQTSYLILLKAFNLTSTQVKKMTEEQLHKLVEEKISTLDESFISYYFENKYQSGGEGAYQSYSDDVPESAIHVCKDGKFVPFGEYLKSDSFRRKNPVEYANLMPKYINLTTSRIVKYFITISGNKNDKSKAA